MGVAESCKGNMANMLSTHADPQDEEHTTEATDALEQEEVLRVMDANIAVYGKHVSSKIRLETSNHALNINLATKNSIEKYSTLGAQQTTGLNREGYAAGTYDPSFQAEISEFDCDEDFALEDP
jgi:hypothetical protein